MSKQILQMFAAHDGAIARLLGHSKEQAEIITIIHEEVRKRENNG